jgi:hypothetical protein
MCIVRSGLCRFRFCVDPFECRFGTVLSVRIGWFGGGHIHIAAACVACLRWTNNVLEVLSMWHCSDRLPLCCYSDEFPNRFEITLVCVHFRAGMSSICRDE